MENNRSEFIFETLFQGQSYFYVLKNNGAEPEATGGCHCMEFLPDHIYYFLPSLYAEKGESRVYSYTPQFLAHFDFCTEIPSIKFSPRTYDWLPSEGEEQEAQSKRNTKQNKLQSTLPAEEGEQNMQSKESELHSAIGAEDLDQDSTNSENMNNIERRICTNCFVKHFPQPNTKLCKLKKERSNAWQYRVRGGAKNNIEDQTSNQPLLNPEGGTLRMVDRAISCAEGERDISIDLVQELNESSQYISSPVQYLKVCAVCAVCAV